MSRLILFSGGVESTALLEQAREGDVLLVVGPHRPGVPASYIPQKATRIAAHYGLGIERAEIFVRSPAWQPQFWSLINVAMTWVAGDPRIDEVWYGMSRDDIKPEKMDYIDRLNVAWRVLHKDVPLRAPLLHLGKAEQWALIPDAVRPLVHTCIYPYTCGGCSKCDERLLAGIPLAA